jgi:hypothetical protein
MSAAEPAGDLSFVEAEVNYSVRTNAKPVSETYGRDGLERRYTGRYEKHRVRIADARPLSCSFRLDESGFELVVHPTQVKDFFDVDELKSVYYAEMRALIAERSGAAKVHVFDHTLRSGNEEERAAKKIREPVRAVHNDYTEWSGPQRVRDLMGDEAECLLRRRFAIVQTWRAIRAPIEKDPLAIADARSIAFSDFIPAERRFPERVGEIYQLEYSPRHRWHYFPRMRRDEALVFKVFDSAKDGRSRFSAHTSFVDPASPSGAPDRESIEIRAFAFFSD